MKRLVRHFIALCACVGIFTGTGSLHGFAIQLDQAAAHPESALAAGWLINAMFVAMLCLLVVTPVASIADYLFTYKWPFRWFFQFLFLLPLLFVYLIPWSLFFGRFFWVILLAGTIAMILPLLLYWIVFNALDFDFSG